jgi:EpsI family protein
MSALVMAYLYAGLAYRGFLRRVLLLLSAIPVALIANGLRVYITIFVAAAGSPESAAGLRHYLVGWLVFGVILGAMFLIGGRFEEPAPAPTPIGPDAARPASADRAPAWGIPAFVVLGLGIVAVAPLSAARITGSVVPHRSTVPAVSVVVSEPWTLVQEKVLGSWTPRAVSADAVVDRAYRAGAHSVRLNIARFDPQNGDVEISRRPPGSVGWELTAAEIRSVEVGGRLLSINESTLTSATSSVLVWHWYEIDGVATPRGYAAKLLLAGSRLQGGNRPSAVIALATEARVSVDGSETLRRFLEHLTVELSPAKP